MPSFSQDYFEIDVDEFLSQCSQREIEEVIKYLREDGHLDDTDLGINKATSPMEEFFEANLNKLHGSYHMLGTDDIDAIQKIANRI